MPEEGHIRLSHLTFRVPLSVDINEPFRLQVAYFAQNSVIIFAIIICYSNIYSSFHLLFFHRYIQRRTGRVRTAGGLPRQRQSLLCTDVYTKKTNIPVEDSTDVHFGRYESERKQLLLRGIISSAIFSFLFNINT